MKEMRRKRRRKNKRKKRQDYYILLVSLADVREGGRVSCDEEELRERKFFCCRFKGPRYIFEH